MNKNIGRLDWFFILPLFASATMIAEIDGPRESVTTITQFTQGAILVPATLVIAMAVAAGSAIDRRCSEEYMYQVLANSALVAVGTTMLVNLFWVIGMKAFDLPDMSAENMVGVTVLALVLSYYWFRWRGIAR
ncbi:hypothetical protein [Erythrobacter ani]|uniref:Uncharacterized protein n=1 Tax=Erythrobacter ani TaxID=2827235 RepID=A0ABS6SK88_9SPHN|nr:hypothetical protein [Erythrobacter ani]MBV7265411.1 hypothetical protein [Erythrobacter ani]